MKDVAASVDEALSNVWLEPSPRRCPSSRLHIVDAMNRLSVPGVGIGLIVDGDVAVLRSFGNRDSSGSPVSEETMFQAGSISKTITAVVALRLVADGRLDLDDDVDDVLKGWKVPARRTWQPRLTLRQLLSHTAGTTVHGFPGYPRGADAPDLLEVLDGARPANTPPVVTRILPGTQFSYSGGGYCIVQQLLQDVTGMRFEALARQLVFGPLGMVDSGFEQPLPEVLHPYAASGHHADGTQLTGGWNIYPEQAAAGLWSTPRDLARLVAAIQEARRKAPRAILPFHLVDEMLRPHSTNVPYGLGVYVGEAGGSPRFFHGGDTEGFAAHVVGFPEEQAGVVVMTNGHRGGALASAVVDVIAAALHWTGSSLAWTYADDVTVPPPGPVALRSVVGCYEAPAGLRFQVATADGGLVMTVGRQEPVTLRTADGHRWIAENLDVEVSFEGAEDGQHASSMTLTQSAPYAQSIVSSRSG